VLRRVAAADASGERPPLIPGFVVAFIALATLNSTVSLPAPLLGLAADASGWLLLTAIAAVGLKTRPAEIVKVGRPPPPCLWPKPCSWRWLVALALTVLPIVPT
jgi:uncharacterized membrane protein YadS